MRLHCLPRGTLSPPGTEVPDDFRLVSVKVRASRIPPPPTKGRAWLESWGALPSEEKAQAELDQDTCSQEDSGASDALCAEMLDADEDAHEARVQELCAANPNM